MRLERYSKEFGKIISSGNSFKYREVWRKMRNVIIYSEYIFIKFINIISIPVLKYIQFTSTTSVINLDNLEQIWNANTA